MWVHPAAITTKKRAKNQVARAFTFPFHLTTLCKDQKTISRVEVKLTFLCKMPPKSLLNKWFVEYATPVVVTVTTENAENISLKNGLLFHELLR